MKELEFMELLSELPPEYIEAAAAPQKKRRGIIFRKHYGIPVIAACLVVVIAAAIYPRLRVEKPEQIPEPEQTTYTTTVAETSPYEAEGTEVAATTMTAKDAAADQTATAVQSAATERTAADGTRDTRPAQTAASAQNAAPAQQTAQDHAPADSSKPAAKTTARTTASVKATTRTTARTTAPARTTAKTTARTTAPARTTRAPEMTTPRATARTTATPAATTRQTARTTAPERTTAVYEATMAMTGSEYSFLETTAATRRTNVTAVTTMMTAPNMTTAAAATTAPDGSSGGGHWYPGSPGDDPWSGWHHSGQGEQPPSGRESAEVFLMQALVPAEAYEYLDGLFFFGSIEDGDGYILPDNFRDCALPDGVNPADYNVLPMYYYGYIRDAVVTEAGELLYSGFNPSVCVLETGSTFRQFAVLFWFPKDVWVDPNSCTANIAVEWNADSFYGNLPDIGDSIIVRIHE